MKSHTCNLVPVGLVWLAVGGSLGILFSHGLRIKRHATVDSVIDTFWQWRLRERPEIGTGFKLYTHEDQLEQYTEETLQRRVNEAKIILSDVETVDTRTLNAQDKISIDLLKTLLDTYINGYQYRVYGAYNPISVMGGPVRSMEFVMSRMKFDTLLDFDNWISRLQLLPKTLSDRINLMTKAIKEGKTQNNYSMTNVIEHLDTYLGKNETEISFYIPFNYLPDNIGLSQAERNKVIQRGEAIIRDGVIPAIQAMRDFLINEYIPNTRPDIGVSSLPGGAEYYQACLDWHLGVRMTPQEIHDLGLKEVDRIKGEMEKIVQNMGFQGTVKEYITFLQNNPENFYKSEEEMANSSKALVEYIKGKMPAMFETITSVNLRIQDVSRKNLPDAYYIQPSSDGSSPGIFVVNTYNAPKKAKFNMLSLILHESFPGHHQQIGLASELELPDFRRLPSVNYYAIPFTWQSFTSYIEGWGLYAEKLGEAEDLDVFPDQNSLFGRYTWEIFRACRLVIDTGIHALGWSRQQAVDYLSQYNGLDDNTIQYETNRYITLPGQATAYKIGELKILELRRMAEKKLGNRFDIKKFHTQVLGVGAVPLGILESVVKDWIEKELEKIKPVRENSASLIEVSYITLALSLMMFIHV